MFVCLLMMVLLVCNCVSSWVLDMIVYCLLLVATTVVTTMVIMVVLVTETKTYEQLLVNKLPTNDRLSYEHLNAVARQQLERR